MSGSALGVVREFVDAQEPSVRGCGVHALAALGNEEAAELLVGIALDETTVDAQVRAEIEIAGLPEAERGHITRVLERMLEIDPRRAYSLLGRLRMRGALLAIRAPNYLNRLRHAQSVVGEVRRRRGWHFWVRGIVPALVGTILGMIAFVSAMYLGGVDSWIGREIYGGEFWVAFPIAALGALLTTPTQQHFDRFAGTAVDSVGAAVICASAVSILLFVFGMNPNENWRLIGEGDGISTALIVVWVSAAFMGAVAVRITVAVVGFSVAIPVGGRLVTVATGAISGVLGSGATMIIVGTVLGTNLDDILGWPMYWVGAFTLAWVFASLDAPEDVSYGISGERRAPLSRRQSRRKVPDPNYRRPLAFGLTAAVWSVALPLALLMQSDKPLFTSPEAVPQKVSLDYSKTETQIAVDRAPYAIDAELIKRGTMYVRLFREEDDSNGYEMEVIATRQAHSNEPSNGIVSTLQGRKLEMDLTDLESEESASITLDKGTYRIIVTPVMQFERVSALSGFISRIVERFGSERYVEGNLNMTLRLGAEQEVRRKRMGS